MLSPNWCGGISTWCTSRPCAGSAADAHLAEDVAQGVFTALARPRVSLTGHPSLTGWLLHHHAQCRGAGAARRASVAGAGTGRLTPCTNFLRILSRDRVERLRPVIDEAMDELSELDREAILLRFFADRPFAEVGEKLALSENAARMRAERALNKLRALLVRRGITSTSTALALALANQAALAAPAGLAATVTAWRWLAQPPPPARRVR